LSRLTFLGTGNFLAPGRYWNSFVLDDDVLVEPAPTSLPNLRRAGIAAGAIQTVVISHFHADHTFGWPFLLLELLRSRPAEALWVVGPPGVESHLADMMRVGSVRGVHEDAHARMDIRYVEVDGTWQQAGMLRLRAVEVEHVPYLRCYGFLFDRGPRTLGYSGDTRPCGGLDELAHEAHALVLECNGPHPPPPTHMEVPDVRALQARNPGLRLILTHLGEGVEADVPDGAIVPSDFAVVEL